MRFVEAFKRLGYEVENPRQDWSAERPDGVCLTLWTKETDWKSLVTDTRIHANPIEQWGHKPGNSKRIRHARRAIDEYDGWVDIVKIDGEPGVGYRTASPWKSSDRNGLRWRITYLENTTGHLRLEAKGPVDL